MEIKPIAKIKTDFNNKFGIPRQSTLINEIKGTIVFEKEFANFDAVRELEQFSHIWLIWGFDKAEQKNFSPTVRPPRLGGNKRIGVFASRSPFRPNSLGLSCVKLEKIEQDCNGAPILRVSGVDMLNHTPIYDIKPYLPYVDSKPDAVGGFAEESKDYHLNVNAQSSILNCIPNQYRQAVIKIIESDPRPSYQDDSQRVYGFDFAGYEIKFSVNGNEATLISIEKIDGE